MSKYSYRVICGEDFRSRSEAPVHRTWLWAWWKYEMTGLRVKRRLR